jgi:hypothetical protein
MDGWCHRSKTPQARVPERAETKRAEAAGTLRCSFIRGVSCLVYLPLDEHYSESLHWD